MLWVKVHVNLPKELRLHGFGPEESLAYLSLLCVAGADWGNQRGELRHNGRPATLERLSFECGVTTNVVSSCLEKAIAARLMHASEDEGRKLYAFADWNRIQGDATAKERKRRQRERERSVPEGRGVTRDMDDHDVEENREDESREDQIRTQSHAETVCAPENGPRTLDI